MLRTEYDPFAMCPVKIHAKSAYIHIRYLDDAAGGFLLSVTTGRFEVVRLPCQNGLQDTNSHCVSRLVFVDDHRQHVREVGDTIGDISTERT